MCKARSRRFEQVQFERSKEGRRRTGMRIINDGQSEKIVGVTLVVRDHGSEHEIGCEICRNVQKRNAA